jgi:hypothetical protein
MRGERGSFVEQEKNCRKDFFMYNIEIMPLKKDIYQNPTEYDFLPFRTNITYKSGFELYFSFEKFHEVDEESEIITEKSIHPDSFWENNIQFICDWMVNLNKFPIYVGFETDEFMANDLKLEFDHIKAEYQNHKIKNGNIFFKVKVSEATQLKTVISPSYMVGSWNNFACWSFNDFDVSFEEGEYAGSFLDIVINFSNPKSALIWIAYDGHSLVILSNEDELSALENLIKTFPRNTNIKIMDEDRNPISE